MSVCCGVVGVGSVCLLLIVSCRSLTAFVRFRLACGSGLTPGPRLFLLAWSGLGGLSSGPVLSLRPRVPSSRAFPASSLLSPLLLVSSVGFGRLVVSLLARYAPALAIAWA